MGGAAGEGQQGGANMLGTLIGLMVAEKSGFAISDNPEMASLKELAAKMTKQAIDALDEKDGNGARPVATVVLPKRA